MMIIQILIRMMMMIIIRIIIVIIIIIIITCYRHHLGSSIDVLETGSLSLVCKIIHCRKIINNISWHPASNFDLSTCSPFCWWIAVASGSSDVYVFDLKNVIG